MSVELKLYSSSRDTINVASLKQNISKALAETLISPALEDTTTELAPEHKAEAIKSMDDLIRISDHLIVHKRFRDNMLFILGINFGLRVSDLRVLRFSDLINPNLTFKDKFPVFEKKTRNTRARKMNRYITINDAVIEAVTLYLENTPNVCLSDYMFRSLSPNGRDKNEPISRAAVDNILKGIASELNITAKVSTHTLRKTFGYWVMVFGNNDYRQLMLLQKIFNHSSPAQTLQYIGITDDEIADAYYKLNLGGGVRGKIVSGAIHECSAYDAVAGTIA